MKSASDGGGDVPAQEQSSGSCGYPRRKTEQRRLETAGKKTSRSFAGMNNTLMTEVQQRRGRLRQKISYSPHTGGAGTGKLRKVRKKHRAALLCSVALLRTVRGGNETVQFRLFSEICRRGCRRNSSRNVSRRAPLTHEALRRYWIDFPSSYASASSFVPSASPGWVT